MATPRTQRHDRPDHQLVEAIVVHRDQRALIDLASRYQAQIMGPIRAIITHDSQAAEEARQDTLLKIWNGVGTSTENLRGWIATVSRNAALNVLRTSQRAPAASEFVSEQAETSKPLDAYVADQAALFCALSKMTVRERELLVMRYYEQRDDREISAVLFLSDESVRSLAHRALRRLRFEFEQCSR